MVAGKVPQPKIPTGKSNLDDFTGDGPLAIPTVRVPDSAMSGQKALACLCLIHSISSCSNSGVFIPLRTLHSVPPEKFDIGAPQKKN
jgi:hypothetical protein